MNEKRQCGCLLQSRRQSCPITRGSSADKFKRLNNGLKAQQQVQEAEQLSRNAVAAHPERGVDPNTLTIVSIALVSAMSTHLHLHRVG